MRGGMGGPASLDADLSRLDGPRAARERAKADPHRSQPYILSGAVI